ncbi:DUF2631 domain-containing protein [Hoyosella rhizosphaerae]|uniref:DUF2631 domain-containing protein n=1 Tax=Hoyosella rhizosphaerae TaxID=1755582 RepID=A0A916U6B6_9ACTN|nr:DUF2631 domain-containing protein [Hoyosella rhizosphaerae]MBN4926261.1 DUF2631 domain-containing protein [Hoyosella rhizosphaerae]GGC60800.1 hypothetical protein GCM10011410_11590 [Hoyosella rhizosphaerae]
MANTDIDPGLERAIARSKHHPAEEPSVGWGWHGESPVTFQIVGWVFTIMLFAYLIGTHQGQTENLWVIGTGVVIAGLLVKYGMDSRRSKRR